jgi:hypothetical protein
MAQIGPPRKGKAKLVFRDGVAHFPDPEAEIWEAIKNMRRDAQQAIIAEGGNPKQTARLILDKKVPGYATAPISPQPCMSNWHAPRIA